MRIHTVDYNRETPDRPPTGWFNRGVFLWGVPRLIPLCRLLGHRPVVDGVGDPDETHERRGLVSRWVCCDRCGLRPDPQGRLDPGQYRVGERYHWPLDGCTPPPQDREDLLRLKQAGHSPPGEFPPGPTGEVGGQVIVGPHMPGWSAQVKIGNAGSEHVLAAHARVNPLGAIYLHTERHGTWLQRRLNPTSFESRVIDLSAHDGRLWWRLWAPRDSSGDPDLPRWRDGSVKINPLDVLFGRARFDYADVGGPRLALVRMPHGDDHQVTLQLQRRTHGRPGRRPDNVGWVVHWSALDPIPTGAGGHGRIHESGIEVPPQAVRDGSWPEQALAAAAVRLTQARAARGYQPTQPATDK